MAEPYPHPVALRWDGGPELLRKLKNKLQLYFQSKNKSHGGECQLRELDCSRGYIVIHFREQTVRDQVLQKTDHELKTSEGKTIKLSLTLPKSAAEEPHPVPGAGAVTDEDGGGPDGASSQVLIENIQDSCPPEMLTFLVENISEKNGDSDFHVELLCERSSAVITFTCGIDVPLFIQRFSKSLRATQLRLTAKPLEETLSIRAENLPPRTDQQHLTVYFESHQCGGGRVQEVVMLPEEGAALLTFTDTEAVKMILKREHVFNKTAISVYPYYLSLNIHLYGTREPHVTIPGPVEFNISPYILEHILNNQQIKHLIDGKMEEKYCQIRWPSPDLSNPMIKLEISPSLSSNLRTMVKVSRTWTDNVSETFSLLMSRYKVIECKMNPIAWEDIRGQVSSSADYNGVLVKPNAEAEKVFLSGTMKDVDKIEQKFRSLVKEIGEKVERNSRVITMKEAMSEALYHVIDNSGLKEKILADIPELKMKYEKSTHNLLLTGVREEVLQAKCEILSVRQQLKSKPIQLNPHVLQFLMVANPDKVSSILFVNHNINAVIEVEDGAIRLIAYSKKDLTEAEEQITRELMQQRIAVEDKSVLRSPEWGSLQSHLESFNSETCTILIQEFPPGAEDEVVVSGFSSNVQKSFQQMRDFVNSKTVIEVPVPVRARIMLQFIEEERSQMWQKIQKMVKVVKKEKSVSLFAPRLQAEDAAAQLTRLLSSLHYDSLRIDKPGAKKFCKRLEEIHAMTAKASFGCVIVLEASAEDRPLDTPRYEVRLQSGVTVAVYQDDLCRHNVDVIVNAANEDLQHSGGLALALLKAAGPKLQDDCNQIVKNEGVLSTGDSVITDAGNLPCKQVIHTVGPRWDPQSRVRCERLLRRAITTSLEMAAEKGHSSIAIPAVSSGIFGFPLQECVANILKAIEDFTDRPGGAATLQRIHLVDRNVQTINMFSQLLRTRFGDKKSSGAPDTSGAQSHIRPGRSETPQVTESDEEEVALNLEGMTIRLVQKKIEDATTDVIVNSVGADLDVTKGNVSSAISNRAGATLQQLVLDEANGALMSAGKVIATDGCNLGCKKILHVVTPQWDKGQGASETILRKVVQHCLNWTNQQRLRSLSIPALGTGNLGFPKVTAAAAILDVISQFSSKNKPQHLQEVEIVLHPNDKDTIQAFNTQLVNFPDGPPISRVQGHSSGSVFCGSVTNPSLGVHEMRIGSITFQVKTGDITKEVAGVIVNSSNQNFTLHSGVSKAILEAAGPSVQSAATTAGSLPHKGYIVTDSGNLESSKIIHVSGPSQPADVKKIVLDCLQESEKLRASCVSFPALGTGAGHLVPAAVADAILDGVVDFISSGSAVSVQSVKVVIFQQRMLNDFYMSMKKKEGTALPGPRSFLDRLTAYFRPVPAFLKPKVVKKPVQKLTAFQLLDNIEPVTFSLCSDDREKVQRTKQWLQQQIEDEQTESLLTDECISELEDGEYQKILTLQRRFQVSVVYKPPEPSIRISGLTRDVLEVSNEIQKIVNGVKDRKNRERAAELTGNLVEWRYQHGSTMVPFNTMANLELEEAKNADKTQVTVKSQNHKVTVDLKNMMITDKHGNQIKVERAPKHEEASCTLPNHWQQMGNRPVMEVDVTAGSPEYSQVQQLFARSCQNRILKIQRIQNKDLWPNYQIKKQSIDTKNGTTTNEKQLFHGTNLNSIKHINQNGFNRSYAGKNGVAYGNGTYFAVNASYSAGVFSASDTMGHKHMYLARVLTGEFCAGQRGMLAPPPKNPSNTTDLYDSVTDNVANPTMFVIFNDIQAYPEYHITFC